MYDSIKLVVHHVVALNGRMHFLNFKNVCEIENGKQLANLYANFWL